jgi:adenosylhomocysteine nucleosidase
VLQAGKPTAILSALDQEQSGLFDYLEQRSSITHAGRAFHTGLLFGHPVVLALARIGKVAAATTTAALIERFGATAIVFTGVAGGVGEGVKVGDVVLGSGFVQHDMDASPLFPRYEIPLSGSTVLVPDAALQAALDAACSRGLTGRIYDGQPIAIHHGLIASGDRFVNSTQEVHALLSAMRAHGHNPLAVEMECAAVAQTCADYGVPFAAVRTISDRADDNSHVDFMHFIDTVASHYAREIILNLMRAL